MKLLLNKATQDEINFSIVLGDEKIRYGLVVKPNLGFEIGKELLTGTSRQYFFETVKAALDSAVDTYHQLRFGNTNLAMLGAEAGVIRDNLKEYILVNMLFVKENRLRLYAENDTPVKLLEGNVTFEPKTGEFSLVNAQNSKCELFVISDSGVYLSTAKDFVPKFTNQVD